MWVSRITKVFYLLWSHQVWNTHKHQQTVDWFYLNSNNSKIIYRYHILPPHHPITIITNNKTMVHPYITITAIVIIIATGRVKHTIQEGQGHGKETWMKSSQLQVVMLITYHHPHIIITITIKIIKKKTQQVPVLDLH